MKLFVNLSTDYTCFVDVKGTYVGDEVTYNICDKIETIMETEDMEIMDLFFYGPLPIILWPWLEKLARKSHIRVSVIITHKPENVPNNFDTYFVPNEETRIYADIFSQANTIVPFDAKYVAYGNTILFVPTIQVSSIFERFLSSIQAKHLTNFQLFELCRHTDTFFLDSSLTMKSCACMEENTMKKTIAHFGQCSSCFAQEHCIRCYHKVGHFCRSVTEISERIAQIKQRFLSNQPIENIDAMVNEEVASIVVTSMEASELIEAVYNMFNIKVSVNDTSMTSFLLMLNELIERISLQFDVKIPKVAIVTSDIGVREAFVMKCLSVIDRHLLISLYDKQHDRVYQSI